MPAGGAQAIRSPHRSDRPAFICEGNVVNWYLAALRNYAGFSGRARRTEYWMFVLFNAMAVVALAIVGAVVGTSLLVLLYELAVLLPSLAVSVRRLHDTGRSGWWLLIGLIPLVGTIILIVFTVSASTQGATRYGSVTGGKSRTGSAS